MDIMGMALLQGRRGNLNEAASLLQLFDGRCSAESHTGTKSAQHLENGILYASLVCHTALYAFGNQLLCSLLEIAILAAVLHR